MTRDSRYPDRRVPRRSKRGVRGSTRALTAKLTLLAVVGALAIGGLIAAQLAAGNDPALGPKAVAKTKKAQARPSSSDDGYYGNSSGYSSGSSGYSSGSGYSTQQSAPAPVTSSTS